MKLLKKIKSTLGLSARKRILHYFPKNAIGAEIGVWKGDFSEKIIRATNPKKLYLIDPWMHQEAFPESKFGKIDGKQKGMDSIFDDVKNRFSKEIESGKVVLVRSFSKEALEKMDENYLDWIYIDGNHSFDYVMEDLNLALKKVKPGGIISGDDYSGTGWWKNEVIRAVDTFLSENKGRCSLVKIIESQFILRKES